jgi:hypothetical protein
MQIFRWLGDLDCGRLRILSVRQSSSDEKSSQRHSFVTEGWPFTLISAKLLREYIALKRVATRRECRRGWEEHLWSRGPETEMRAVSMNPSSYFQPLNRQYAHKSILPFILMSLPSLTKPLHILLATLVQAVHNRLMSYT